jgi:hypothetical protein
MLKMWKVSNRGVQLGFKTGTEQSELSHIHTREDVHGLVTSESGQHENRCGTYLDQFKNTNTNKKCDIEFWIHYVYENGYIYIQLSNKKTTKLKTIMYYIIIFTYLSLCS